MLKDSKILGSIPRSCQALYVKILQSRNSLPKIKGIFQRCIPIRPPEQTKKAMLDPQKKRPFIRMRASSALSTHLLRYGHVGGTVLCLAAAGRRGFEGLAEGADGDEALEMLGHKVAM